MNYEIQIYTKDEFVAKLDGSLDRKIKEAFIAGYWATAAIVDPEHGSKMEATLLFYQWKTEETNNE